MNLEKKIKDHEQLEKLDILKSKKNDFNHTNSNHIAEIPLSNISAPTIAVPSITVPTNNTVANNKPTKLASIVHASNQIQENEEKKVEKVEEKKVEKFEEKKIEKVEEKKGRDVLDIISSAPLEKYLLN